MELDEAAWIFSSYYYRLAFQRHDLRSPDWRHADALDHPPLAKFMFGALLERDGLAAGSLTAKERWFKRSAIVYDRPEYTRQLRRQIPPRALWLARLGSGACMALACLFLSLLGALAFSPGVGAAAALLLVLAPLTRILAAQAVSDSLFTALLLGCALAQALWCRRLVATGRFSIGWSALCGGLIGLLFGTKILGIAGLPLMYLSVAFAAAGRPKPVRFAALLSAAIATTAAAAVAIACNPSLYREPVSFTAAMFRHRLETVELQKILFFAETFQTPAQRLAEFTRLLFMSNDGISLITSGLTAVLAAAGLLSLPVLARARREPAAVVTAVHLAGWALIALAAFSINWTRYLLPAMPLACLLAALGGAELAARRARAWKLAGCAVALAALAAPACRSLSLENYWKRHPDAFQAQLSRQVAELVSRYPERRDLPPRLREPSALDSASQTR